MQAGPRHIAQGVAEVGQRRCAFDPVAGKAGCDAPRGGQQEVARAAGGVDDGKVQQLVGIGFVQHRIEGCIEQRLHQRVGRVVRPGGLALVALLLGGFCGKDEGLAIVAKLGLQFQQGFIDRTQLLGFHRAPVDGDHAGFIRQPRQAIERLHKGLVTQAGGFEVGQTVICEKAAEGWKGKGWLAMGEGVKDDLDGFIAVVVLVPRGGAIALFAQGREGIALCVKRAGIRFGACRVKQVAILGHHEEDQAVDKAQEFVEPLGQVHLAGFQPGGKVGVGLEKAGAKNLERDLDLRGKAVAGNFAFLGTGVAPTLQRAICGGRAFCPETGPVDQQPQDRKGGDIFVDENLRKIGFDIGWPGQ